jgi:hypothetical protein
MLLFWTSDGYAHPTKLRHKLVKWAAEMTDEHEDLQLSKWTEQSEQWESAYQPSKNQSNNELVLTRYHHKEKLFKRNLLKRRFKIYFSFFKIVYLNKTQIK